MLGTSPPCTASVCTIKMLGTFLQYTAMCHSISLVSSFEFEFATLSVWTHCACTLSCGHACADKISLTPYQTLLVCFGIESALNTQACAVYQVLLTSQASIRFTWSTAATDTSQETWPSVRAHSRPTVMLPASARALTWPFWFLNFPAVSTFPCKETCRPYIAEFTQDNATNCTHQTSMCCSARFMPAGAVFRPP